MIFFLSQRVIIDDAKVAFLAISCGEDLKSA